MGFQVLDALAELAGDSFQVLGWGVPKRAAEDLLAQGGQFQVPMASIS